MEKFYGFLTVTDSQGNPSSADGKAYRHRLHYGGYLIEKIVDDRITFVYEDEDQNYRIELHTNPNNVVE